MKKQQQQKIIPKKLLLRCLQFAFQQINIIWEKGLPVYCLVLWEVNCLLGLLCVITVLFYACKLPHELCWLIWLMPVTNEMHVMRIEVVNICYILIIFLSKVSLESPVKLLWEKKDLNTVDLNLIYVKWSGTSIPYEKNLNPILQTVTSLNYKIGYLVISCCMFAFISG